MSDNYLQLKSNRFSRYNNFVYIDTTGFLADRIFIENKVRVKFCGDYKHREKNYVIVICKVKEKDGKIECVIDSESATYKGDYFVFACDTKVTFSRFLKGMPKDLKLTYKKRKTYPIISSFHIAYDIALPHFDLPEAYIFECKPNQRYKVIFLKKFWIFKIN